MSLTQKKKRILLVLLFVFILGWIIYSVRASLTPFVIGGVSVYLMVPIVKWFEEKLYDILKRRKLSKIIAIILTVFIVTAVIAGLVAVYVNVLINQISDVASRLTNIGPLLDDIYENAENIIPESIFNEIREYALDNVDKLKEEAADIASVTAGKIFNVIVRSVSFVFSLIIVPIWVFAVLADQKKLSGGARNLIPESIREDTVNVGKIADNVFKKYIRGQVILSTAVGAIASIGLMIIGVDYALPLGIISAFTENIPTIGPLLGMIPALVVAFPQGWPVFFAVLGLYVGIQLFENMFLVPKIAGESTDIHPAVIMLVLVIGGAYFGLIGMLIAAPMTAVIRDVFKYLYMRLSDQEVTPSEALERVGKEKIKLDGI